MNSYCEENWDEDEPPRCVSGEWKGYSDWDYNAKKLEFDPHNSRCDGGWRNEIEDSHPKPQNSYTKQNEHTSTNKCRSNFRQDRLSGNSWRGSREFTSGSRYSNSRDSKSCFSDRKLVDDLPSDFLKLTISSSDVGKVIGKGGSKIRELQDESGAKINIIPSDNQPETLVELRGSKEHQKKAKELIEFFLSNFGSRQRANEYRNWNSSDNSNWSNQTCFSNNSEDALEPVDWDALIKASEKNRAERLAALPPIKKQFYFEDHEVSNISEREANDFRIRNNNITVSKLNKDDDRNIPNPVCNFKQAFNHYPDILDEIEKQGFTNPSPIQCQAWPILLQGYDMIGIAQTGTGKTIAFLLPAMIHIDNQEVPREERSGPTCLILAPTRELAQQIEQETKKYKYRGIKCVCLYGGGSRREQINIVTKGVEIVIATPGRLNDLVMNKIIDVSSVTYLVLDEADRMLDMGFEPQIKKILIDIRPDRQTVMTSATWPEGVRRLADRYMDKPYQVCIGTLDLTAVHSVTQRILLVSDEEKRDVLFDFLYNMGPQDKVIVFVDRKSVCDDLSSDLVLSGIDCQSLHGDREQCDREQALDDLKTGLVRILVATDVASRGLDIKDITHIFNYSFPRNIEEYVHRVGRTGRAGRTGESVSLVTRGDWKQASELIKILKEADQEVPNELITMAERYQIWKKKKDIEDAACGGSRFKSGKRGGRRF